MLFNSLDFALFLPIVFIIYWALSKTKLAYQNFFVLCASFLFYGWWDWRFLCLIALSIVVDYFIAKAIDKQENKTKRKQILFVSIFVNIGLLFAFKYFNFFLDNISDVCSILGVEISLKSLNIILPVGISFYTFQTLSYTIDVYRNKIKPTNDFVAFAAFVGLVSPGVTAPDPLGTVLMIAAGIAWGVYSLRGKNSQQPLQATAGNFLLSVPMALVLYLIFFADVTTSLYGVLLACASGAGT